MMTIKLRTNGTTAEGRTGRFIQTSRRVRPIAFCSAVLAIVAGFASAAPLDASYFGFSTNAANNFTAMRALESYANGNGTLEVVFQPGTYIVNLPTSAATGYRGLQQGACMLSNVTDLTIDATRAEFYCANMNGYGQSIFNLRSCSNVTINAHFRGEHRGETRDSVKAVYLVNSNSAVNLNLRTTRMYEAVRIGDWEEGAGVPLYEGNRDITVIATNLDTFYGVAVNLANNVTITNESVGTIANNFGAHRSVYIAGSSNITAYSWCRDLNVHDGCNLITTAPAAIPPYHYGGSNITLYATDMGTTNWITSQSLAKLGVVSSSVSATNITHQRIHIIVDAPSTATIRTNNYTVAIHSLGTNAAHTFTNITVSGKVERGPSNTKPTIYVDSSLVGLSSLQLSLDRFYDAPAPTRYTVSCNSAIPVVAITAIDSVVNGVYLAAPAKQTFQNLGQRLPAPTGLRVADLDQP